MAQVGAHVGGAHTPPWQLPERQSELVLHAASSLQVGEQLGGPHLPSRQLPDRHPELPVQVVSRQTTSTFDTLAPWIVPEPFVTLQTCTGVVGWVMIVTS